MDHGQGHGMMMGMGPSPPPSSPSSSASSSSSSNNSTTMMAPHHRNKMMMMMMHMTFYWGTDAQILFSGWPGTSPGMYALSLLVVFVLAVLVEWLSRSSLIKPGVLNDVVSGLVRTVLHALRMGLAYLVMLAIMSFNGGVFIAAVAGHAVGFLVFGTRAFGLVKS
ncbi:hypothetical protein Cgig2_031412 [Carnegiea gigantea]|uniref:Copper transport protein n=1 Tax=Carnegiea gigantea TaxID=171969 RepID=A0A9Q1QDV7_9CARY|nr:hypothetical protein Cgig2_031412 [Carnegiea gigantea]